MNNPLSKSSSSSSSSSKSSSSKPSGVSLGFEFNTLNELKDSLTARGLSEQTTLQQYWEYSMNMLKTVIESVADNMITGITQNDNEKYMSTFKVSQEKLAQDMTDKKNRFAQAITKISWTDEDITLEPTAFFKKFFSHCISAQSITGDSARGWRNLFEHIGASSQCDIALKNLKGSVVDWNLCYICGLPIYDTYNPTPNPYPNPDPEIIIHSRECEHILPAFTALGYKGLIQSRAMFNKGDMSDSVNKFFCYEYANSHRCCNRIKSDDIWIRFDGKKFVIDNNVLKKTLESIFTSNQHDCTEIRRVFSVNNKNVFVNTRSASIITNFLEPILIIINQDKEDYGDLFQLSVRIRQVSALKQNLKEFANAYIYGYNDSPQIIGKFLIRNASKLLCKKQFSNTFEAFEHGFRQLFSGIPLGYTELLFTTLYGYSMYNLPRIGRRLYDYGNNTADQKDIFLKISVKIMTEALNKLDEFFDQRPDEAVEEETIVSIINEYTVTRSQEYDKMLYSILLPLSTNTTILAAPAVSSNINDLLQQLSINIGAISTDDDKKKQQITVEINTKLQTDQQKKEFVKNEAYQLAGLQIPQPLPTSGGSRQKKMVYKMTGGINMTEDEDEDENEHLTTVNYYDPTMIEELKKEILNIGEKLYTENQIPVYNPATYGISLPGYTTRSSRVSLPHAQLSEGWFKNKKVTGIMLQGKFFMTTPHGIIDPLTEKQYLYNWQPGKGTGIITKEGNFIQIGGLREKKKKYTRYNRKNTNKSRKITKRGTKKHLRRKNTKGKR